MRVEPVRPVISAVRPSEVDGAEVVHNVAAADDEDALVTERGELPAELEVVVERPSRR